MLHHAAAGTAQSLGIVAVAKALYDQTGSKAWLSAAAVGRLLPYLLISGVAGVLVDRFDRRRVLLASTASRAVLLAALAGAVAAGAAPIVIVLIVTVATALGTPCYPALAALMPATVPAEDLAPANGILSTIETTSWVVGPAAGGLLLIAGSASLALACNAGLFAFGLLCLLPTSSVREPTARAAPVPVRSSLLHDLTDGLQAIVGSADIAATLLLVIVVNVMLGGASVGLVLVAERLVDLGPGGFGLLNAALGAGGIIGLTLTNRIARSHRPLLSLTVSAICGSLPFALLAVFTSPTVAIALMMVAGAGSIVTEVVAMTILLRSLPQDVIGRVFGIIDSLLVASILGGSLIAPALVEIAGLRASLVIVGGVLPATVIVGGHQWRRLSARGQHRREGVVDLIEPLQAQPWLRDVLPVVLEALAATASREMVADGVAVIRQGDEPDAYFVLLSGQMVVTRREAGRPAVQVNRLGAGEGFGEIGLLGGVPRTATVTAEGPAVVLRIRGEQFVNAVNSAPNAADASVGAGLVARLARTSELYD